MNYSPDLMAARCMHMISKICTLSADVKRVTTRDDGTLEVTLDDIVGQDNRQDNGKEAR